jgi:hypothetical protein
MQELSTLACFAVCSSSQVRLHVPIWLQELNSRRKVAFNRNRLIPQINPQPRKAACSA